MKQLTRVDLISKKQKDMKNAYSLSATVVCLAGCLGAWLSACTTGEEPVAAGQPLEIAASITPLTRATADYEKTDFSDGDQINVGAAADAVNTTYRYDLAKDRWLPVKGVDLTTSGKSTTFYAAYPTGFTAILSDQSLVENYKVSNQLKANTTTAGNYVQFSFAPAAAKITLSVIYSDNTHEGISATLTGSNLISSGSTAPITFYKVSATGKTHTYVAIVRPGTLSYTITVNSNQTSSSPAVADNRMYTQTSKELKAGYNYIYNFSSTNDFILNGVQVKPFQEMGTTDVGSAT